MLARSVGWGLVAIVAVPLVLAAYIFAVESMLALAGPAARRRARPWLWLAPALILVGAFLVYPAANTIVLAFMDAGSTRLVGFANFRAAFTDPAMLIVLRNNLVWLVVFTAVTVVLGLLIAAGADRVRYESAVKAVVFLPMAISFVAAGVIWKFMYQFQPAGTTQIGTVNAIFTAVSPHFSPQAWLFNKSQNNWALIMVGVWMWVGFSVVIISAGLKGISTSFIEAARIDGANEAQIFFRVILPLLRSTVTVVATTLIINVLKVFDVVYVMTNGSLETEVIANRMYKEMFNYQHFGRASALAVILLAAIIPVMVINIRRFGRRGG